jgi:hypothetical protein
MATFRRKSEYASRTRNNSKGTAKEKSSNNFFENFTALKKSRMRSNSKDLKVLESMPYNLLVSNFRRKFIL